MATKIQPEAVETIAVAVRGQVLEQRTFASRREAEVYKLGVRRWAALRGIAINIWSRRAAFGSKADGWQAGLARAG